MSWSHHWVADHTSSKVFHPETSRLLDSLSVFWIKVIHQQGKPLNIWHFSKRYKTQYKYSQIAINWAMRPMWHIAQLTKADIGAPSSKFWEQHLLNVTNHVMGGGVNSIYLGPTTWIPFLAKTVCMCILMMSSKYICF